MYFTAKLHAEKCVGCKLCIMACPDPNVISFVAAHKRVHINEGRCKGCGLCMLACKKNALIVAPDAPDKKG